MLTPSKRVLLIATATCALLIASGCGNNDNGGDANGNGANDGNDNGVKTQNYADDGYLGRTNSYPRIPGHHMTSTYANDTRAMSEAIKNVPGVAGSRVTFNGAEAYVSIKLAQGLKPNEIPTVESQAASVLRFNFPRYSIHVSSMK
ncbi:hypothetical protein [Cohnella sp. GCM10027633]|uniref:hypothetical protein n=1 Tax=unclassified Cohnella TaxID=2636738 RepID=UPI003626BB17